jgi:hypothetical protein
MERLVLRQQRDPIVLEIAVAEQVRRLLGAGVACRDEANESEAAREASGGLSNRRNQVCW